MPIGRTTTLRIPYLMRGSKPGEIATQSQQIAEDLEAKVLDGTLRGPAGPAGLPGVNAVPADTAVAGYVSTLGSKTYAAIVALIRKIAGETGTVMATTALTGENQPAVPEDDTAIRWTAFRGEPGMWSATNPTRLVATRPGTYFVSANVALSQAAGGMRGAWFRVNGKDRFRGQSNPPPSSSQYAELDAHNYLDLNTGDYVEIMATVAGAAGSVAIMANTGTQGGLEWRRPL